MVQQTEAKFADLQEAKVCFNIKFDFDFLLNHELHEFLPGCVGVAENKRQLIKSPRICKKSSHGMMSAAQ